MHLPSLRLGSTVPQEDLSASSRRGHQPPGSDDAFFQTLFLFTLIRVFLTVPVPFVVLAFVVFLAAAFDVAPVAAIGLVLAIPMLTFTEASASRATLILASAFTLTGEVAMPPTKLATKPSQTAVLTKLVQNHLLAYL